MKTLLFALLLCSASFAQTTEVMWQYWTSPCSSPALKNAIPLCKTETNGDGGVVVFVLPSSSEVTGFNVTVEYTDAEGKRGSVTDSFKAVRNASSPWIPCQFLNLTGIKVKRVTVVPHPVVITVEAQ